MLPLDTPRLRFREMTHDDLDAMAALLGDSDIMQFYRSPKSREEAAEWIAWNRRNYAEHGYGLWIVETHEGAFIGECGLTWQRVNGTAVLEVGYHVSPAFQGRGLATEAAEACREFARAHTDADQLVAIIHPGNRASERVAEKIGMSHVADDHAGAPPVRRVLGMPLTQV